MKNNKKEENIKTIQNQKKKINFIITSKNYGGLLLLNLTNPCILVVP